MWWKSLWFLTAMCFVYRRWTAASARARPSTALWPKKLTATTSSSTNSPTSATCSSPSASGSAGRNDWPSTSRKWLLAPAAWLCPCAVCSTRCWAANPPSPPAPPTSITGAALADPAEVQPISDPVPRQSTRSSTWRWAARSRLSSRMRDWSSRPARDFMSLRSRKKSARERRLCWWRRARGSCLRAMRRARLRASRRPARRRRCRRVRALWGTIGCLCRVPRITGSSCPGRDSCTRRADYGRTWANFLELFRVENISLFILYSKINMKFLSFLHASQCFVHIYCYRKYCRRTSIFQTLFCRFRVVVAV